VETLLIFAADKANGGSGATSIILLVAMMGVMYMVLIRPQQKKQKDQASYTSSVEVGDKVVTSAGIYGTINHMDAESVHLEVDRDVVIQVARAAIMRSQDAPPEPAKGGGMLAGLFGGGPKASPSEPGDDLPSAPAPGKRTNKAAGDGTPNGKNKGGTGKQRPKR
jgi:preprotein translocase subunit YajC